MIACSFSGRNKKQAMAKEHVTITPLNGKRTRISLSHLYSPLNRERGCGIRAVWTERSMNFVGMHQHRSNGLRDWIIE